jgi:phage tail-like protein
MVSSDPYQVFNFLIEIEGLVIGGFSECSGLQVETELFEYREGGLNEYMHNFVGSTKYTPLVLKHGLTSIDGLWDWHQEIVNQGVNQGIKRRNGTIYLLDQHRTLARVWNFKQAFPYKWTGPELRADSSEVAFESVELVHRGLNQVPA